MGHIIPRPMFGLKLLCSISPRSWHHSGETCRSFNNCYELRFIKCTCWWMD